ncbi:MAG: Gfo/Idh/MocA family oxidoreductase [Candidatus Omnitrophica bacterium]|nr:Gfo/Idh/MocA family oxidoreductase [Candidatus Omnitrophota bacterium]
MPVTIPLNPAVGVHLPHQLRVPNEVAVVGCGRWGKVICNVLTEFSPPIERIVLVAARNTDQARSWVQDKRAQPDGARYERVTVTGRLEDVLSNEAIPVAFVTNMAAEHYAVTKRLLQHDKHVFVEKPFVLTTAQAEELVQLAQERGRTLVVGHEYLVARFMHHLHAMVQQHLPDIRDMEMVWEEPPGEEKWGLRKQPDASTNVITNLYPHVLSQLFVLFGYQPITLETLESKDRCWHATMRLRYGDVPVTVTLDKAGTRSVRRINVTSLRGDRMTFDYSEEPGTLTLNGRRLPDDPQAHAGPRPLPLEITHFFAQIDSADPALPTLGVHAVPIVEATERADAELQRAQLLVLRAHALRECPTALSPDVVRMLIPHLVCPLLDHGLISHPKDERALEHWITQAFRITHQFSHSPWTTQAQTQELTGLPTQTLRMLNAAIRDSALLQQLMVQEGLGRKYWTTIIPMIRSGVLDAVLTSTYRFPLRTGIYPGVSCMFFCGFCGRNPRARYAFESAPTGNAMFEEVFASTPRDRECTFSFSGGLEPLTNPGLGGLIRSAKRHGIRVPLITNGYMLAQQYLKRQPGLWSLDSLRVSLYGIDEASYDAVTRVRGAFEQVKRNVIAFLRMRNEQNPALQFGLNFIILRSCTEQVLRVLDLIGEINASVTNGRGVDFLTLREDFSVTEAEGLTPEERARLIDTFRIFRQRWQTEAMLSGLEVDFGYALLPLSEGVAGKSLAMVTHEQMRPKAYPQISVVIDLLGDVYLYREAGFLERPGAERYKIGTISTTRSLEQVIRDFLDHGQPIAPLPTDPVLLDAFDHIATILINQAESDAASGIPFNEGPVRARCYEPSDVRQPRSTTRVHATSMAGSR